MRRFCRVVYDIRYRHGDAEGYTNETFEVDGIFKNKIIKMILEIFQSTRPEWRDNFLYDIGEGEIEEYLVDNYEEEDDSPELWDEIEVLLREQRAREFYGALKEAYLAKEFKTYELEPIEKVLSKDFDDTEDKESFYKELFDVCFDVVDMYEMLIPDITCENRFARIEKLKIKEK